MRSTTLRNSAIGLVAAALLATLTAVSPASASELTRPPKLSTGDQYTMTSSWFSVPTWLRTVTQTGYCGAGDTLDGKWGPDPQNPLRVIFIPKVTVEGDWILLAKAIPVGANASGTTYSGVSVTVSNQSWIHSHNARFTWTCNRG